MGSLLKTQPVLERRIRWEDLGLELYNLESGMEEEIPE